MRIVYLTDVNVDLHSGVLNKLNMQVEAWKNEGHEVHFISIESTPTILNNSLLKNVESLFICKSILGKFFFKSGGKYNFVNKILNRKRIQSYINALNPDIIYVREMIAFPFVKSFFKKIKGFKIMESNTVLKDEIKQYGKISQYVYRIYNHEMYSEMDGFVTVTDEISGEFNRFNKPCRTISNGIKFPSDNLQKERIATNDVPKIIFVGSPNQPWHGVDKFIQMASFNLKCEFHLVGPVLEDMSILPPNVIQHGYLDKTALSSLYSSIDIGVGSLALFRNKMREACPLKVREYLMNGLPIIIGYLDKDLTDCDFVLAIENEELGVEKNREKIEQFINRYYKRRVKYDDVRELISVEVKEKERMEFFSTFIP